MTSRPSSAGRGSASWSLRSLTMPWTRQRPLSFSNTMSLALAAAASSKSMRTLRAVGRSPAFGDLVEARGLLGEAGRHIPVAAKRQQGGAQAAIALAAFGDQAAPVGMDGADAPDPVVHGGVADQRAAPVRGRTSRASAEPGCGGPPHDPSPPAIPPAGIAPSGRGL